MAKLLIMLGMALFALVFFLTATNPEWIDDLLVRILGLFQR